MGPEGRCPQSGGLNRLLLGTRRGCRLSLFSHSLAAGPSISGAHFPFFEMCLNWEGGGDRWLSWVRCLSCKRENLSPHLQH